MRVDMELAKFVSMYFLDFLEEGAIVVPRRNSGRPLVVMQPWRGRRRSCCPPDSGQSAD